MCLQKQLGPWNWRAPKGLKVAFVSVTTTLAQEHTRNACLLQASRLSFGEVLPAKEEPQGDTAHRTLLLLRVGRDRAGRDEDSPRARGYLRSENWRSGSKPSFPGNGALVDARYTSLRPGPPLITQKTPCSIAAHSTEMTGQSVTALIPAHRRP